MIGSDHQISDSFLLIRVKRIIRFEIDLLLGTTRFLLSFFLFIASPFRASRETR